MQQLLVRDVVDYDRVYKKLIKAVPLSDVLASFAMERIASWLLTNVTRLTQSASCLLMEFLF
ncbi:hypothetical protein [Sphingorhabdus sp. YGSMI21]|uniref:hypothetical protein n=1 Tax=Sphingorhabdus sp. YGSMI21 TaxID=2077182 RepID=UPI000C1E1245|nr:hypothetical protein [Sphingorhabdus sp. YGSMI21]ATW03479.1 hypothetical protein CHN51_07980 [Sphingorhabdus sp. YGSMI21]